MGRIIIMMLTVLLAFVVLCYAKDNTNDYIQPNWINVRLYFLVNGSLMSTNCETSNNCTDPILISEGVKDYALEESQNRLYWLANNESIFLKQYPDDIPVKEIILPSGKIGKISYDILTNKLNLTDYNNSNETICITNFYPNIIDKWINVNDNFKNYGDKFHLPKGYEVLRIVRDYNDGLVFVLTFNGNISNIYRFNDDGSNKTLIREDVNAKEFEVDYKNKIVYWKLWRRVALNRINYNTSNLNELLDTSLPEETSMSRDENNLLWMVYEYKFNKYSIAFYDDYEHISGNNKLYLNNKNRFGNLTNHYKIFDNLKFDTKPYRLQIWRNSKLNVADTTTQCSKKIDCQNNCLLSPCWPFPKCECESDGKCSPNARDLRRPRKRQIPYDLYSPQQPTLRPEPMPTVPDVSYLPFYLYPGK